MLIHATDRTGWKRCRMKDQFRRVEGLVPVDSKQINALWFGGGIHLCIEAFYKKSLETLEYVWEKYCDATLDMSTVDLDALTEATILANGMMRWYKDFAEKNDDFTVIEVEKTFDVKVPRTRVVLTGRFDLLIQDQSGRLWIVDHKTCGKFTPDRDIEMDDQFTAYLWIAREVGLNVSGVIVNMLRKKLPTVPKVLTSGALSQDKSQDTTYDIYMTAIKAFNLDSLDYIDILDTLKNNEFFRRVKTMRSPRALDNFGKMVEQEVREMTSSKTPIYHNRTFMCNSDCEYTTLCKCIEDGGDIEYTKSVLYRKGTPRG